MKISTIIKQARRGELSGLSDKAKTDEAIVDYTNRALTTIYNRFQLRNEEAIITLVDGKTIYRLDGSDADVSMTAVNEFISITKAFDEAGEIPINDDSDDRSIYTVGYNAVQVPLTATGSYISVVYRAGATEIEYSALEEEGFDNVPLPNSLMEALLNYVAYVAHKSYDDPTQANSISYLKLFNESCREAENFGLVPADTYSRDRSVKGFV